MNEPPSEHTRNSLPWLTVISWSYDGTENNGMPPRVINERMMALEDAIEDNVIGDCFCQHAISKTGSNLKELIYYIHDRDSFMEKFNAALKTHDRYPIEITFYHDPDWREHAHARDTFSGNGGEQNAGGNGS